MDRLRINRASEIAALQRLFADVPKRPDVWVRASENRGHVGAVLAEAALQPGVDYVNVVSPRVERVLRDYQDAATVAGLRGLLERVSVEEFLQNKNTRKCGVFRTLVHLLSGEGIETSDDLRIWLEHPDTRRKLIRISGLKHKTAAYLRLLMGLPAIAIDVHLRRAAAGVGVTGTDEELEALFTEAAAASGISLRDLDGSIWQAGTDSRKSRATNNR